MSTCSVLIITQSCPWIHVIRFVRNDITCFVKYGFCPWLYINDNPHLAIVNESQGKSLEMNPSGSQTRGSNADSMIWQCRCVHLFVEGMSCAFTIYTHIIVMATILPRTSYDSKIRKKLACYANFIDKIINDFISCVRYHSSHITDQLSCKNQTWQTQFRYLMLWLGYISKSSCHDMQ